MAKVNSLVKRVLMSIVTVVSFIISQLEPFNRVTSIGGGLIGYGSRVSFSSWVPLSSRAPPFVISSVVERSLSFLSSRAPPFVILSAPICHLERSREISPLTPFLRPSGGKRAKLERGRDDNEKKGRRTPSPAPFPTSPCTRLLPVPSEVNIIYQRLGHP